MAEVGKLSASKISSYMGCSFAYYLNYVEHEKIPTNIRLAFGRDIHYMLEKFYKFNYKSADSFAGQWKFQWMRGISGDGFKGKAKRELEVDEYSYVANIKDEEGNKTGKKEERIMKVGNHIDTRFFEDVPGVIFGYMNLGTNILKRFYEKHKERAPPISTEESFGVRKDSPFYINGHLIRGIFDRIDKTDKGYFITDYKTDYSSPKKNSFYLHTNLQFSLYSYAFRELYGEKEKAMLFYHLRSMERFETHRGEKDYHYIQDLLDNVAEGITKDKFVPFYGFHCKYCNYMTVCDKYNIKYRDGPRIVLGDRIKSAKPFDGWDKVKIPAKDFEEWDSVIIPEKTKWVEDSEDR